MYPLASTSHPLPQGETYACALSKIYTFGPTFRAEYSFTSRHLAEFWMIEPEMAFCDLEDDMRCAEDYVRSCCLYVLRTCRSDLEFVQKMVDPTCIERLEHVASSSFQRCSYTEAIEILEKAVREGKKFEYEVKWGIDLQSEHERYITEVRGRGVGCGGETRMGAGQCGALHGWNRGACRAVCKKGTRDCHMSFDP